MKVKWLGHACFLITSGKGLRIITDPYTSGGDLKYAPVTEVADVVTMSHDHFDHNSAATVSGRPQIVRISGVTNAKGIQFRGVATYHDEAGGKHRGRNIVFCFSVDGFKLCHLGDLGHRLSQIEVKEIGEVDLLFIPVGGNYTIDAAIAQQVCDDLKPKVIFPMHYRNARCNFPITGVDDFLKGEKHVSWLDSTEIEFKAGGLSALAEIVVLKPAL